MKRAIKQFLTLTAFMSCILAAASAEEVVYVVNTFVHNPGPPLPDWGTVAMCRARDLEVLDVLTVGDNAHSATVSPDGAQLWVTCDTGNSIYVIDTARFEIVDVIDVAEEDAGPMGVAFTPDGSRAWVTMWRGACIYVYDAESRDFVERLDIGDPDWAPSYVLFSNDGGRAFVIDTDNGTVMFIGTGGGTWPYGIVVDGNPLDAVISPDGGTLYVCNMAFDRIEVIDVGSAAPRDPINTAPAYTRPRGIGISPDGAYLFISFYMPGDGKVAMYRIADGRFVAEADIPDNGRRLMVSPDGSRVYVADHNADECYAFDVDYAAETLVFAAVADMNTMEGYHAAPIGLAYGDYDPPNYINIDVTPEDLGVGETGSLSWECDFSEWNYEGAPVDVYLAVIKDPVVSNGPCSVGDALAGGEVWLYGDRQEYAYTGPVREPTWSNVSFPPVALEGALPFRVRGGFEGDWVYAVCFIRRDRGSFVRTDGLQVEVSNLFSLR